MKTYGITIDENGIERSEKHTTPFELNTALNIVCLNEHLSLSQITNVVEL